MNISRYTNTDYGYSVRLPMCSSEYQCIANCIFPVDRAQNSVLTYYTHSWPVLHTLVACITHTGGLYYTHSWPVLHTLMACITHTGGLYYTHWWPVLHPLMACITHTHGLYYTHWWPVLHTLVEVVGQKPWQRGLGHELFIYRASVSLPVMTFSVVALHCHYSISATILPLSGLAG